MLVAVAREPRTSRPGFRESYGIAAEDEGMLPWSFATERLADARNYWIGTSGPDGRPSVTPVWGVWIDDSVVFGTADASRKARNLASNPRVVVHLESGDEAVILEGEVEPAAPDEAIAAEYERKYDWRPEVESEESGGWFRLRPRVAFAWVEKDYPTSATRFDFEE
jgi:Pyridoxamine 5'-phosphate oxidase